jgi:hypothetical protein
MAKLQCVSPDKTVPCEKPAVWYVWFKDRFPSLYTYACDEHLDRYVELWRDTAHPVSQAQSIDGDTIRRWE